jgi:hypothetical protein
MNQRKTPTRMAFQHAYRAARLQHRFLIEIDAVIDRYREIAPASVPWDKIYTAVEGIYFEELPPDMRKAVLHAVRG